MPSDHAPDKSASRYRWRNLRESNMVETVALWINDPAQVILLSGEKVRRASMSTFIRDIGGLKVTNAAIRAGIHHPYSHLRFDPDNRVPEPGIDSVGARYLTIGPYIPAQLVLQNDGTDNLEAFMRGVFHYNECARLAAVHVARWCGIVGVDVTHS